MQHFLILTFIVIIVVIMLTDNLTTAVLVVSILANFLIISTQMDRIAKKILITNWGTPEPTPAPVPAPAPVPEENPLYQYEDSTYGPRYAIWNSYKTSYDSPKPAVGPFCSENNTVDAQNALQWQQRARDKKCIEGLVTKNANFYKYHYAGELDQAEKQPWWGNAEF